QRDLQAAVEQRKLRRKKSSIRFLMSMRPLDHTLKRWKIIVLMIEVTLSLELVASRKAKPRHELGRSAEGGSVDRTDIVAVIMPLRLESDSTWIVFVGSACVDQLI